MLKLTESLPDQRAISVSYYLALSLPKCSMSRPVALITGSATGVGRAAAIRFATEGYDVVVNYSRSQSEAEQTVADCAAAGAKTLLVQCDVSDEPAVQKMVEETKAEFSRLDVLVNNAAMTHFVEHANLDELTADKWDRMLSVNLKGPFFVTRAAVDLLRADADGKDHAAVVNVSSVAGLTGHGSSIAYAASKAGLNCMTKSLARSLAPHIRVNAVCPGPIDSRWIREGDTDWDLDTMTADYPLPRPSQPDDIADAIWFLAAGTSMVTGQLLPVDGGQTIK